jgi:Na+/proline symporter
MVTAATTVPAWVWHTTTFFAATITLALIAVLTAHIVVSVLDDGAQTGVDEEEARRAELRSRLARVAGVLLAVFLVVVLVRAGILLAERPSR